MRGNFDSKKEGNNNRNQNKREKEKEKEKEKEGRSNVKQEGFQKGIVR